MLAVFDMFGIESAILYLLRHCCMEKFSPLEIRMLDLSLAGNCEHAFRIFLQVKEAFYSSFRTFLSNLAYMSD